MSSNPTEKLEEMSSRGMGHDFPKELSPDSNASTKPGKRRTVTVFGKILDHGSGHPIFNAKVRHMRSRSAVQSSSDGAFSIVVPAQRRAHRSRLILLKDGYWACVVERSIPPDAVVVDCGECALHPIQKIFEEGWPGFVLSLLGPRLHSWWLSRTGMERALIAIVALFFVPPGLLFAVARGVDIPWTEWDEEAREFMLSRCWKIAKNKELQFSQIRPHYLAHVRYLIAHGTYDVSSDVEIEATSEVRIEKDCHFRMKEKCGFLVKGKLVASGEVDHKITFEPAEAGKRWRNITFWEAPAGSLLEHCSIQFGSGREAAGSDTGVFLLDPSSPTKGGGLLVYNTLIHANHISITECAAHYGGGLYLRSSPEQVSLPGSMFIQLRVEQCVAQLEKNGKQERAGGGGIFVQRCYPNFDHCEFIGNKSVGEHSCGGGVMLGVNSRGKFNDCIFNGNIASAEGGGLYAYDCMDREDENNSGVVCERGTFEENRASGSGGALSAVNSRVRLDNVVFLKNSVTEYPYSGRPVQACGGAVYLLYDEKFTTQNNKNLADTRIQRCEFRNNSAAEPKSPSAKDDNFAGGAFVVACSEPLKIRVSALRFDHNTAWRGNHVATSPKELFVGWNGIWDAESDTSGVIVSEPSAVHVLRSAKLAPVVSLKNVPSTVPPPDIDTSHPLPATCYSERPVGAEVNAAVLHFISASEIRPSTPYDLDTILGIFTAESAPQEKPTSAHYLIARNGTVYRLVDEAKMAWHAGLSRMPSGEERVNDFSIGIEVVRTSGDLPTDAGRE